MDEPRAYLVFTRSGGVLLAKRPDADWRQLQDEFPDYMTSLGPWTADEIAGYFAHDYTEDDARWPLSRLVIAEFMRSPAWLVSDRVAEAEPGAAADPARLSASRTTAATGGPGS